MTMSNWTKFLNLRRKLFWNNNLVWNCDDLERHNIHECPHIYWYYLYNVIPYCIYRAVSYCVNNPISLARGKECRDWNPGVAFGGCNQDMQDFDALCTLLKKEKPTTFPKFEREKLLSTFEHWWAMHRQNNRETIPKSPLLNGMVWWQVYLQWRWLDYDSATHGAKIFRKALSVHSGSVWIE